MFSVIIPLYNKERHIEETIQTVLNQTFTKFEIIVVNDGSTDNSLEVVQSIKCDKIRVINQKNQGVSVARNEGVKRAKYNYLLFLDADDGLMPNYFSELTDLINEFPNAGLYATNFCSYKSKFKRMDVRPVSFLPEKSIVDDYFGTILDKGSFLTSITVIKKDVFEKSGGYVRGMIRGQDTYLLSKILLSEKVCFLNKPLYFVTYDSDNRATASYRPSKTNVSLLDHLGSGVDRADEFIITYSLNQVEKLIKSGYKKEAMKHLKSIKEKAPSLFSDYIESRLEKINKIKSYPYLYYKARKLIFKRLVYLKDCTNFYFKSN